MIRHLLTAMLLLATLTASAVPARRGQWQTITLATGATVRVQLVGDEFNHFLQAEDGTRYVQDASSYFYVPMTAATADARLKRAAKRRAAITKHVQPRRTKSQSVFQGTKKALVILANFTDLEFKTIHNLSYYKNAVNGIDYVQGEFHGSVRDYFRAQSGGSFDIDFDVVGPCPLKNTMAYYGRNLYNGDDARAGEMVAEACLWAHSQGIDFSQYDWDGDGEVDQVFVLYAGKGEADGGGTSSIWPHMFNLQYSDYGKSLKLDGVTVDTYACSCELNGRSGCSGIGTFCHEFSHCMGFPDFYDTGYSGWFGMGSYDLMDSGSYNGNGFRPTGYSAYEKNECGWITLHDMTDIDDAKQITNLKPISEYGDAYVVRNKNNADEYYIVEYRRNSAWDTSLPSEGVMITHVDYDKDIWDWNVPNTSNGLYYAENDYYNRNPMYNKHQRFTIFHANNSDYDENDALYPYNSNNSLTRSTLPASSVYALNADNTRYMHVDIKDIAIAADGNTASVTFAPAENKDETSNPTDVDFHESFNQCDGEGRTDGLYTLSGVRITKPQKGVNIVRYADGSSKKIVVK